MTTPISKLTLGQQSALVELAQIQAAAMGFYKGKVDRDPGPQTQAALDTYISKTKDTTPTPLVSAMSVAPGLSDLQKYILRCAGQYIGLIEITPNRKWDDPTTKAADPAAAKLATALIRVGWQPSWAYCIAFVEAALDEAYGLAGMEEQRKRVAGLLSVSVMDSYAKCRASGLIDTKPRVGAVFFLQKGRSWTGHAGIVTAVSGAGFHTIEGNTGAPSFPLSEALEREGEGVYAKSRALDFNEKPGLWLRGFFNPLT